MLEFSHENVHYTMVENGKKHRQNSHLIIHCPTSEGVSEVSEQTSERTSEWPSIYVPILGYSAPLCARWVVYQQHIH